MEKRSLSQSKAEHIQTRRDSVAILQSITVMIRRFCFACCVTHSENKEVVTVLSREHAFCKNSMITFCKMSPVGLLQTLLPSGRKTTLSGLSAHGKSHPIIHKPCFLSHVKHPTPLSHCLLDIAVGFKISPLFLSL